MRVLLCAICHFALVVFNILPLSLIFVSLITMCLAVFLRGFILPGTLHFLDLVDYFLFRLRQVFSYYLFKYFLRSFLSLFSFQDSYNMNLVYLMLFQRSLRLSSFLFFLSFSFFFLIYSVLWQ